MMEITIGDLDLTGTPRAWFVDVTALFLREFREALLSTPMSATAPLATTPQPKGENQA